MFKTRFEQLCNERKISPAAVCEAIGLSNSAYSKWTENSLPRNTTLLKIAEYFNVSIAYLKGETDDPDITLKERLFPEIATDLRKKPLDGENINIPEFCQTLLFFFENCDAPGQLRIIQLAMNEYDRTQKEKTDPSEEPVVG